MSHYFEHFPKKGYVSKDEEDDFYAIWKQETARASIALIDAGEDGFTRTACADLYIRVRNILATTAAREHELREKAVAVFVNHKWPEWDNLNKYEFWFAQIGKKVWNSHEFNVEHDAVSISADGLLLEPLLSMSPLVILTSSD